MNTELKVKVPLTVRSECLIDGNSQHNVEHMLVPPRNRAHVEPLESPDEIARALRLARPRTNRMFQAMVVALGMLVVICILLAAIVWWRLLT